MLLKIIGYCGDASILNFACRAQNDLHGTFGNLLSHGNPIGNAHQVGILELHPWPFVPVIQ